MNSTIRSFSLNEEEKTQPEKQEPAHSCNQSTTFADASQMSTLTTYYIILYSGSCLFNFLAFLDNRWPHRHIISPCSFPSKDWWGGCRSTAPMFFFPFSFLVCNGVLGVGGAGGVAAWGGEGGRRGRGRGGGVH